jgi:hypothetical protein
MRRVLLAVIEYLLGFLALAFFAFLAFGSPHPTDERLLFAFKAATPVAVAELAFLCWRPTPANRLILGANLWLVAGGLAAWMQQWWWLQGYQRLGEASLFMAMGAAGLVTTVFSPSGFVAATGPRRPVVMASLCLLLAVGVALIAAMYFRGNVKFAAVIPVIALSWLNRLLRRVVQRQATSTTTPQESLFSS